MAPASTESAIRNSPARSVERCGHFISPFVEVIRCSSYFSLSIAISFLIPSSHSDFAIFFILSKHKLLKYNEADEKDQSLALTVRAYLFFSVFVAF